MDRNRSLVEMFSQILDLFILLYTQKRKSLYNGTRPHCGYQELHSSVKLTKISKTTIVEHLKAINRLDVVKDDHSEADHSNSNLQGNFRF